MNYLSDLLPVLLVVVLAWLVGLTGAMITLWGRLAQLRKEQHMTIEAVQQIGQDIAALRRDLIGVAQAQQVADLRRQLIADLNPLIQNAVALASASKPKGARASATAASAGGVINSGQAGNVQTGAGVQKEESDVK